MSPVERGPPLPPSFKAAVELFFTAAANPPLALLFIIITVLRLHRKSWLAQSLKPR